MFTKFNTSKNSTLQFQCSQNTNIYRDENSWFCNFRRAGGSIFPGFFTMVFEGWGLPRQIQWLRVTPTDLWTTISNRHIFDSRIEGYPDRFFFCVDPLWYFFFSRVRCKLTNEIQNYTGRWNHSLYRIFLLVKKPIKRFRQEGGFFYGILFLIKLMN